MYEPIQPLTPPVQSKVVTTRLTSAPTDGCKLNATGHLLVTDSVAFNAVDVASGSVAWSFGVTEETGSRIVGVLSDGKTFILAGFNKLVAIQDDGVTYHILWSFDNPVEYQNFGIMKPAVGPDDRIYYHTRDLTTNSYIHVICVNAGSIVFDVRLTEADPNASGAVGLVAFGNYYCGGGSKVHAVNAAGSVVFVNKDFRLRPDEVLHGVVDISSNLMFFSSSYTAEDGYLRGVLYAVDENCNRVFSFATGTPSGEPEAAVAFEDKIAVHLAYADVVHFVGYDGSLLHTLTLPTWMTNLPLSGVIDHIYYWCNSTLYCVNKNDYSLRFSATDPDYSGFKLIPWSDTAVFLLGDPYLIQYGPPPPPEFYVTSGPVSKTMIYPTAPLTYQFSDDIDTASLSAQSIQVKAALSRFSTTGFNWRSTNTPTPVTFSDPDEGVASISLSGFDLVFGGTHYTQLYVCTNGYIGFDSSLRSRYSIRFIPTDTVGANPVVFPFWHDFELDASSSVYYFINDSVSPRELVITFENVPEWGTPTARYSFQIVFKEGVDEVIVNYLDVEGSASWNSFGQGTAIGFQHTYTEGVTFSYNPPEDVLKNSYALKFSTTTPIVWEPINAVFEVSGSTLTIKPLETWPLFANLQVSITTGLRSVHSQPLKSEDTRVFAILTTPQTTLAFEVISTTPTHGAVDVDPFTEVRITFSSSLDTSTVTSATVQVRSDSVQQYDYQWSYDDSVKTLTLIVMDGFESDADVTITLTEGLKSIDGVTLTPFTFNFRTKKLSLQCEPPSIIEPFIASSASVPVIFRTSGPTWVRAKWRLHFRVRCFADEGATQLVQELSSTATPTLFQYSVDDGRTWNDFPTNGLAKESYGALVRTRVYVGPRKRVWLQISVGAEDA